MPSKNKPDTREQRRKPKLTLKEKRQTKRSKRGKAVDIRGGN